jgi:choline dehydrogenase-like flavoprotein
MLIDTAKFDNRVLLDEDGAPEIEYALSDPDRQRFAEGIAEAIRIMFKAGAKEVYLPTTENLLGDEGGSTELRPQVLTSSDQAALVEKNLHFVPDHTMITSAHMQSTDKMGSTAENSVVGQDFHVWGTRDLYVVDGSIFPTSIGANPMQSIYTVAKIFADHWNTREGCRGATSPDLKIRCGTIARPVWSAAIT